MFWLQLPLSFIERYVFEYNGYETTDKIVYFPCVNIIADWLRDRLDVRRDSVKE